MDTRRSVRIIVFALSALALTVGPAAARSVVDPNTLNPAPPDFFNAVCESTGVGTSCTLAFSDPAIVNEPSGIVCGSTEILFSQDRSVVGKRFYDGDGNLVQRHFREMLTGTFTNPGSGAVVNWIQHDTVIHNLAVPGDLATGTTQITGLLSRAWVPGGGTVLTDVGTVLIDASTEEAIRS